jgi:hypothetical protein
MSTLNSMAPYSSKNMIDMISIDNPKYKDFYLKGSRREELLANHSISQGNPYGASKHPMGDFSSGGDYHTFMYADLEADKGKRLQEYRLMSGYDIITNALDQICDEFIVMDDDGDIFQFTVDDSIDKLAAKTLRDEFEKFIQYYELDNKGWEYMRNILIDGELYFENVISEEHKDKGILGVVSIPTENIDPIYNNVQNMLVRGFLLRKPIYDDQIKEVKEVIPIIYDKNQVSYFHSHEWDEGKHFRLPLLEKARQSYKRLNMIEDSVVIHRLVNAPEKLIFKVDVGNMPQAQSERYIQQLAQKYWSKKTYDSKQGGVNMFNPQSMLDAFWFPKREGSEGTDVTKLQGGQSLGDLPELAYFSNKLFQSLNVPASRLMGDTAFSDGTDMLREELHFSRFVIRLQKHFAESIKENFITHLKLRGWWKDYELSIHKLTVRMNEPTHFNVLRKQQLFEIQSSNFASMAGNELISELYAQKRYLDWDDDEILTNQAWLAKEKAIKWRLMNIEQFGPDWRKQAENAEGQAADDFNPTGGGGSGLDDLGGEDFGGEGGVEGGEDESVPPDGLGGGGEEAAPDESES